MIWISQKYFLYLVVITTLISITYSHENDTATDRRRHGRVNGRIVKLYSGPKPDPILCVNEGFLADAVDCSVFYRCLKASNGKYTVYRFQCGPGTIYDPDTEICNHPRSTKRSHCGGITSDKHLSSTQKYNENEIDGFEKDNEELPSPIITRRPTVNISVLNTEATTTSQKLDSSYTTTHYPWLTTSKHMNNEIPSTWSIPALTSSVNSWEYSPTKYVTPQPVKQRGILCTSDGFMGDPEDCRKFYRCVNNQRGSYLKYEFSCSESTIWDDDTQGCNHPWAVQRRRCGKGNSYDENSIKDVDEVKIDVQATNHVFQQQTQISYGSKITQIQTQINKAPEKQNQTQISFGDRINQEKLNTVQSQMQTNYGDDIIQSHNQVDYGSQMTQTHPQDNYSNKISQTQTSISETTLLSTATAASTQKHKYSSKCTKVGFVGDSNDCKKFYRCIRNERGGFIVNEFSCSEGTLWDEYLEACNHARNVKCGEKKSSGNIPSPVFTEKTTKDHTTTFSPLYGNEINEINYMSEHIQQDLKWPKSTPKTTLKTTTNTKSPKLYESDCKKNGFFGYVNDCKKFYRCVEDTNGKYKKYDYRCGDGTVWDPTIQSCNHAWEVRSCSTHGAQEEMDVEMSSIDNTVITTVSLIQTTTQKNIHSEDHSSGYGTFHSETSLQPTSVTEQIVNQRNECKQPGFMGDSKDCTIFYRCVEDGSGGYKRHDFTCGKGTVWDAKIEACNHAWAVENCGGDAIKDNSTGESTPLQKPSPSEDSSSKNDSYNINQEFDQDMNDTKTTTSRPNTSNVTTIPDNGNGCQRNGFMGHDTDCKIFYRCVENGNGDFIRYEFTCGDGTVWDPNIAACNHVWAVEKCGGNKSTDHPNYVTSSVTDKILTQNTTISSSTMSSSSSTIITTTISNINNECKGNGFIGDKQDCKKFYRCVEDGKGSYLRYEFTCGEGTLWDPKIEACNHAWAVTSCGLNEPSDPHNMSTHHPVTIKDEEIYNNTNDVTANNQEINSSTESNSWSSTVKSSTMVNDAGQCNGEGFIGDAIDCRKFYRCVNDGQGNFIRYEFTCSDGTIWDSDLKACNHVNSVKSPCSANMDTQTTKDNEPIDTVTNGPSNSNDNVSSSEAPSRTQNCEQEGFFGDKSNCKKFYRCTDNGQGGFHKYEFTCGEGTIWDQEILACNHAPSSSHCDSSVLEPQTENPGPQSTLPSSTLQSTDKIETSSDECDTEGFHAYSNDCRKFFRCVQDGKGGYIKYDFKCGEGTVWVQDIQACDYDSVPSLCSHSTKGTTTTTPKGQTSDGKPVTTSSTASADHSTSAPNTKPTLQDETVSASSSTTETSSSISTSTSAGSQDQCTESGYFGDSQNCKMFYRCVDNGKGGYTKYDFTCGDGTIWDQDIIACNHPQDVSNPSCDNKDSSSSTGMTSTTSMTTTTSKTTETTEGLEPTKTTSTETTTSESNNQEVPSNKPNNNNYTCTEAGFYADPYDCKKFYRCVDWGNDGKSFSIYHFDCGDGTIWDPELKTCNHEDSVYPPRDCSGKQSQNENSTTTTESTTTTQSSTQTSTTSGSTATTELSSTTDQTSTQQSSSSEQTSSTQQSSTQMSTTEESTTQQSTEKTSTTQKSTTSESTTQQSTTEQTTTEHSTTVSEQTTTQQTSTTQQSGQTSTTSEQSSTSTTESSTSSATEQSSTMTTEQSNTTTTDKTTTSSSEETTTTAQSSTTESTTGTTDQVTKPEQTTTLESSTEQSSENQSSTTEQSTTQETSDGSSTTESGQETSTEQESSDKECPQTDNDQYLFVCPTGFRRHPKYCNMFYQCTEDDDSHEMKVAVFNCPNNTIYDESKTQCVEEEKADKKCDGQIAQRRRVKRLDKNYKEPITVGKQQYFCPSLGHFPFETTEECSSVLFKCEMSKSGKLRGLVYQCPQGYVYWSISRRCEPIGIMINCKRSLINWNGRYEIPIETNNVARRSVN